MISFAEYGLKRYKATIDEIKLLLKLVVGVKKHSKNWKEELAPRYFYIISTYLVQRTNRFNFLKDAEEEKEGNNQEILSNALGV